MKATMKNFKNKMYKLSTEEIKNLLLVTWNDTTGSLFREIGFEIIEERHGEEESDRIYSEIWNACEA